MKKYKTAKLIVVPIMSLMTLVMISCVPEAEEQVPVTDIYVPEPVALEPVGRVLIITDNDFNDAELFYPYYRFVEEGYDVTVASLDGQEVIGQNSAHLPVTQPIDVIEPEFYDALYLPGGRAAQVLRRDSGILDIVRYFAEADKPVGAISHAPQILISAGVVEGRRIAGLGEISDELTAAGAQFINETTVIDGEFVTARMPGDLPNHLHQFLNMLD